MKKRLSKLSSRLIRDRRGVVLVEFALMAPILLLFLVGAVDFGLVLSERSVVESAARAGAQYALSGATDTARIRQVVVESGDFRAENLQVAVSEVCSCPDGTAIACVDAVCTAANADDNGDYARRRHIRVTVTEDYSTLLRYPWLNSPHQITGSAEIRLF